MIGKFASYGHTGYRATESGLGHQIIHSEKKTGLRRFMSANGDELWITVVDGFVDFFDPTLPPEYQASFQDEFSFIEGTGRFEGAIGGGELNSPVRVGGRTEHEWAGELTVRRGRR